MSRNVTLSRYLSKEKNCNIEYGCLLFWVKDNFITGVCGNLMEGRIMLENLLSLSSISVLQSLDQDARKDLTPLKLRAKAAKFAKQTVQKQMASFKVTTPLLSHTSLLVFWSILSYKNDFLSDISTLYEFH